MTKRYVLALLAALCTAQTPVRTAQDAGYTSYRASVTNVVDGDTVDVNVYLGLGNSRQERVRFRCVNTPEKYGVLSAGGERATVFVREWTAAHPTVTMHLLKDNDRDKYGRLIVVLFPIAGGVALNRELLDRGLGELFMCKSGLELF